MLLAILVLCLVLHSDQGAIGLVLSALWFYFLLETAHILQWKGRHSLRRQGGYSPPISDKLMTGVPDLCKFESKGH